MKKLYAILMCLMLLAFTQCKPEPEGDNEGDDTRKVKVSCVIALNNGSRSDFSNLMNGKINWSDGRECVYVAIHGDNPQIIELESWADGNPSKLEFTGEATEGLITSGEQYDIWYFGHSQQLETPYVNINGEGNRLEGSIATQSGRLEELGYCHIATTKVSASMIDGDVKLNLNGALDTKVAIAFLDLENTTELYGDAMVGTDYALQYNEETGRYEFDVIEDNNARINVEGESGISYIMLLPNDNKETKIKCKKGDKTYTYTFHNYVKANKVYFRTASDGTTVEPLRWEEIEETPEVPEINGHEYVDLGLPSGLLWATCNVGATSPEEYGDYFAWGETSTKETYDEDNCPTYELSISQLQSQGYIDGEGNLTAQYDAATANWGGSWRMPTYDELNELIDNCTWTWTTQNGVNGYNVEGPNGNSIFLPAAGDRCRSSLYNAGSDGAYWSSTPDELGDRYAYFLVFGSDYHFMSVKGRVHGQSVRPVSGGGFEGPVAQCASVETAEVTEIKATSAVCGGNVTTDGGVEVTARGICWSTSQTPTIEDNKTTDGSGVGIFTSQIPNLVPNTQYYVRAYATNEVGTAYGEEVSFTTLEEEINEIDGHGYVDLGLPSGLKWATCNVGATSPEEYGDYFAWGETSTKERYDEDNSPTYGLSNSELQSQGYTDVEGNLTAQYDAATANWGGSWRMPTEAELNELRTNCTWTWTAQNGVNGYNVEGPNGNSIFLPAAGYRFGSSLYDAGGYGNYWSSTPNDYNDYGAYYLYFSSSNHSMYNYSRSYGFSVRSVSGGGFEGPVAQCASVETAEVTEIKATSAVCGGNVTTDGGVEVTARGVCWSTSQIPTIEDNKTTDGSGVGIFTSRLSNLESNTTYYVRAYATNEVGTSYGEEVSFTTLERNANGHEYVDLGLSVKWATCNVGATTPEEYGDYFAWGETSTKETYDEDNCPTYGLSYSELQSQGYIDSKGNLTAQYDAATANWGGDWRMPTEAELNELISICTWTWTTQNGVNGCSVEGPNGNSIFLPAAGLRLGSSLYDAGSSGYYWISTTHKFRDNDAYYLFFCSDNLYMDYTFRSIGQSVRPVVE